MKREILMYDKWIPKLTQRLPVVFIPEPAAGLAMSAVHNQFGCKSPTQFLVMFERYFELTNAKTFIDSFLRQCRNCILLRQENTRKPLTLKAVKPPEKAEIIYIDGIQRQGRNQPVRLVFATDGLTRFGIAENYEGSLTSEVFVKFVLNVKNTLCALMSETSTVICRTDGASAHTSKYTKMHLEKAGVVLDIRESSTCSKNMIPAQDVRIKALQKFLVVAFNNKAWTMQHATYWALRMYNQSIGNAGFAPAELFHRRKLGSQADIGVSDEWLKDKVKDIRKQKRESADERNQRKKKKKRLEVVPYEDVFLNSEDMLKELDPNRQFLKVGDCVKLHKAFDKADLNRLWTVVSIDWKNKKFVGLKENMGTRGKPRKWSLEAIDQVVSNQIPILGILIEQQRRRRRAAKSCSELWGFDNQYSIYPLERENDANPMVMVDDSGIISPESTLEVLESVRFELGDSKVEQEVYPMASTPLSGDYVPATPYSEYSDVEITVLNGTEVSVTSDGGDETFIPGLNDSDLSDTLTENQDAVGCDRNAAGCEANAAGLTSEKASVTFEPRRSGRQSKAPDRLGVSNLS